MTFTPARPILSPICDNVSSLDVFYSRRIGRRPQLNDYVDNQAAYADLPDNTRILGAAKITGRERGFTVGILDAVTNRETARFRADGVPGSPTLSQEAEPLANYFVGRLRREFRSGGTTLGGIATSTLRRLDDSLLANRLRSRANVVGLDLNHTWNRQDYSLLASAVLSDVAGSESAIRRTQQSSAHYFQRPDRGETSDGLFDVRYDPARTSLRGYGLYTRLAKDNGDWLWEVAQNWRSPGFEVNDLAFLDRADYKWFLENLAWQRTTIWGPFRYFNATAGAQQQINYDGDRTDWEQHYGIFTNWLNFWSTNAFYIHHPSTLSEFLTRGGPMEVQNGYDFGSLNVNTDQRKAMVFGIRADVAHGVNAPTRMLRLNPSIAIKPATNVFVSLAPSFRASEGDAQYVQTVTDPTNATFNGTRYVFAFLRQRTLSLDTRVNVTFTPDVTLELFAQPFFASGEFTSYREFAAPRTIQKVRYGVDGAGTISYDPASTLYTVDPDGAGPASTFTIANPDFTVRSLRGNAVLRWEYRPGSTVYFVWTQERNGSDANSRLDFRSESSALFRDRPVNIFLLKVNYWLGR